MAINLKKNKNIAEIYAAMHPAELSKALVEEQDKLTKMKEQKTVARALKGTMKDYMKYDSVCSEMDAALKEVSENLDWLIVNIKFTENLIKVIEALIDFKTEK